MVFVLDNPETQTVSHSFPKLCVALQRNFGTDAVYPASRRNVFRLTSRKRIMTTPFAESRSGRLFRRHASHLDEARCDADSIQGDVLIVGDSEVRQRSVGALGAVVVEYDVPLERRGSRIRIERRLHLRSPRVSVDAVLE